MDKIVRDIYFLTDRIKDPIDYPQGADTIPILFTSRDYNLPAGAAVRVCVQKPSGKAVYNEIGSVSGNVITIQPQKQMTAETGRAELQVEIKNGEKELLSFIYPMCVKKSIVKINSENGSNFIDEYLKKIQEGINAMEEVKEKILEMAENGDFSATVRVGDTAALEPGMPASVANVGTIRDAVFNFGIPRGKTGAVGPRGPEGKQGIMGPPGADGADGTAVVTELNMGFFAVSVNEEGHLILSVNEGDEIPPLKLVDGRLKYVIGEA